MAPQYRHISRDQLIHEMMPLITPEVKRQLIHEMMPLFTQEVKCQLIHEMMPLFTQEIQRHNEPIKDRVSSLESQFRAYEHVQDRLAEYEAMPDPYSPDGDPLCNTYDSDHYFD